MMMSYYSCYVTTTIPPSLGKQGKRENFCRQKLKSPRGLNLVNKMMRWCECALTSLDNKRPFHTHIAEWMWSEVNNRIYCRQHMEGKKKKGLIRNTMAEQLGIVFIFDSINLTLLTCHQHFPRLRHSLCLSLYAMCQKKLLSWNEREELSAVHVLHKWI